MAKKRDKGYIVHPPSRPEGNPQASLISAQRTEITSRALPDATELKAYRELDPELYEVLKREFVANGEHRREMQRREAEDRQTLIAIAGKNDSRGMWMSWIFAVGTVAAGVALIIIGYTLAIGALVALMGTLPSIIGSIRIRRTPKKD